MQLPNIKSKTTLQKLRDEGKIRYSQPKRKSFFMTGNRLKLILSVTSVNHFRHGRQENVDSEYLKGFNEGYLMAIYKPDFVEQLVQAQTDSPRHAGFIAGRNQLMAEKEVDRNIVPPWLDELYNNVPSPLKTIPPQKDRDDLDPDKG